MSNGPGRRRWMIAAAVLAVVVVVLGGLVAVRWYRGRAEPVDVADVDAPTGTTLPASRGVLRPPQGVYQYTGSGTDRLDKPPMTQDQGPSMPGTVRHRADGCWTFRIDYSTNHWQQWDYCPTEGGGLDEVGGSGFQRWNFGAVVNETTSTFECQAPTIKGDQEIGEEWRQSCTGTSTGVDGVTRSTGMLRYVGPEVMFVGDERVPAYRYKRERTNSGNQTGTEESDVWFSSDTGMPLRNERTLKAATSTVIGSVNYTEEGTFALTSLDPER